MDAPNVNSNPDPQKPERLSAFDREVFTFLRAESDSARSALRDEAAANREVLLGTLKIVAYPLTVVLAIAGLLGWRSLADLKQTIQNQAHQETGLEIARMQKEIRARLDAQFQTPELRKIVSDAAKEQTGTVLHPLIVKEVSTDVAQSVSREQAAIKAAVVVQAHNAVDELKPTVNGIVEARVNATVDQAVQAKITTQVAPVLNDLQHKAQASDLILRAQGEDGLAFDELVNSLNDQTIPIGGRLNRRAAARAIVRQHNSAIYTPRMFTDKHTNDEMLRFLGDDDSYVRQTAMDSIPVEDLKQNMPVFIKVMTSDPSLLVREAAFRRFNQIRNDPDPKHQIENLVNSSALEWWTQHQAEFTSKGRK